MKRFFIIRHGETLFQRDKSSWKKYTDDKMPVHITKSEINNLTHLRENIVKNEESHGININVNIDDTIMEIHCKRSVLAELEDIVKDSALKNLLCVID